MAEKKKNILTSFLGLFKKDIPKKFHSAVILAAGSGVRFGDAAGKHLAVIEGVSVLVRSVRAFEECKAVDEIVVVTRPDDIEMCRSLLANITKLTAIVPGGETRQASAKLGFDAISPAAELVSIHDAARCLVTPENICAVTEAAVLHGAAAAATKTVDTVKRVDKDGYITETLDRNQIWLVQTPQTFLADMYRAAAYMAQRDGFTATDDCALAERLGFKVKLIDCGWENSKITYPEDVYRAKLILDMRAERAKEETQYANRARV